VDWVLVGTIPAQPLFVPIPKFLVGRKGTVGATPRSEIQMEKRNVKKGKYQKKKPAR